MSARSTVPRRPPTAAGDVARADETTGALQFGWEVRSSGTLPETLFVRLIDRDRLQHTRWEQHALGQVNAEAAMAQVGGRILASRRTEAALTCVAALTDDVLAMVTFKRGSAQVEIAGRDRLTLEAAGSELARQIGALESNEDTVPITFWALGAHGPTSARRHIAAGAWAEVAANYERSTATAVDELVRSRAPEAGRLILWHGEPGTGKTNALRVLAHGWSSWCTTHFVTDPEAFLGAGSSYLMEILTSETRTINRSAPTWKLVVLEDSGELLTADAHERTGQALSRLLNVTDGLLGQGMQVVVLVTTNEPLRRLHPAIQREGRCWKQIEFQPLPAPDANRWLSERNSSIRVTGPTPIADLYAALRGSEPATSTTFGFGA